MPSIGVTKTGTVKTFDAGRGFGFIVCADGREIYFHCTAIEPNKLLMAGDHVKFVQG
jgi:cold shock CspA family protein